LNTHIYFNYNPPFVGEELIAAILMFDLRIVDHYDTAKHEIETMEEA